VTKVEVPVIASMVSGDITAQKNVLQIVTIMGAIMQTDLVMLA
jgi:hypothetical protein